MDGRLQKKIKSNNRQKRYSAINDLIKIPNEEAVHILIYIAKGLKRSILSDYDFKDQVYAMESLIKTHSKDGINFIRNFFEETTQIAERPAIFNTTIYIPKIILKVHQFNNASGDFGYRLNYQEQLSDDSVFFKTIVTKDIEAHRIRESILNKISASSL